MNKAISFDLWVTLIRRNPQFKTQKCELVRRFFKVNNTDEEILGAFTRADRVLDNLQESVLVQPDRLESWALVLGEIGIENIKIGDIERFVPVYNELFLKYPPILIDDVEWLFERLFKIDQLNLYILSNTILTTGETLDKFIATTCLRDIEAFYSDAHYPKPHGRAFEMHGNKPFIHVGDNVIADGKCANFGIEFYQVRTNGKSLRDFWEYIKPRL